MSSQNTERTKLRQAGVTTVLEWADRLSNGLDVGDAVVLDAFAYHFHVNLLVYSPAAPGGPVLFPVRDPQSGYSDTHGCYMLAHTPWSEDGCRIVPVVRRLQFTPALEEVIILNPKRNHCTLTQSPNL